MWKKGTLWVIAIGIAALVWQFLVVVAKTYGLPSSALTPQNLFPMFGLVLIGVGGADIVRYFIRAAIRTKRPPLLSGRSLQPTIERDVSASDEVFAHADVNA